jgi:hypothetical protein
MCETTMSKPYSTFINSRPVNSKLLFILYPLALLAAYPIFSYIYAFAVHSYTVDSDTLALERLCICSPALIVLGLCLVLSYKGVHRIIGSVILTFGVVWLICVIRTMMGEG